MTRENVVRTIQEIFRDIFDDSSIVLYDSMTAHHIDNWDSINHINLLSAIQQEFKIKFDLKELQQVHNVGSIIDLILKKTNV